MPAADSLLIDVDALRADVARESLVDFIRMAWPLVEPTTPLAWNWHLDVLCDRLEAITRGEPKRLIVNIPPGTSKSLTISTFWPAWEWATDPSLRYLTASYTDDNTIRDNRRLRDIVSSAWYQRFYDLRLSSEQAAKVRFDTTAKGWRIASSVGGMGTGEHPDRIIIDDPHKAKEAPSRASRDATGIWFDSTISTRRARDPAVVVVMQRLHTDDLTGRLLSRSGWEHLCFPMRYELPPVNDEDPSGRWDCPCHANGPDPRDPRTERGELLWPELWPEEKIREAEIDLGPYGAAGQLAQRPVPEGGGLYKREWFEFVDAVPANAQRCRGWDTAATAGGGDWTAGVKIAQANGLFYVEHVIRAQTGDADRMIAQTAELDGRECWIREEQEPGASGKAVIKDHARMLVGFDYAGVAVSGSKVARGRPFRAQCEAGNVRIVRGPWNGAFLDELCYFPVGDYDDQHDGASCAFNALVLERQKRNVRLTWGR